MKVALVGCGKAKRSGRHEARRLYTGHLFRAALALAEQEADRVYVLSAKHGLLYLDSEIEAYDQQLGPAEAAAWAARVVEDLRFDLGEPARAPRVTIFAGRVYAEPIAAALRSLGWRVTLPMEGMEIGERLQWLKRRAAPDA